MASSHGQSLHSSISISFLNFNFNNMSRKNSNNNNMKTKAPTTDNSLAKKKAFHRMYIEGRSFPLLRPTSPLFISTSPLNSIPVSRITITSCLSQPQLFGWHIETHRIKYYMQPCLSQPQLFGWHIETHTQIEYK